MGNVTIKITGVRELEQRIHRIVPTLSLDETAQIAVEMIKENIEPFSDTYKLHDSITYRKKLIGKIIKAVIISDMPYSNIQDQGGVILLTDAMRKAMFASMRAKGTLKNYKGKHKKNLKFISLKGYHYTRINQNIMKKRAQLAINRKLGKIIF